MGIKKILFLLSIFCSQCFSQSLIWENRFNGTSNLADGGNCIAVDKFGNIIFGGYQTIHTIKGDYRGGRLIKFSNSGAMMFSISVGGVVNDIETDSSGNIYVASSYNFLGGPALYTYKISPEGSIIFTKSYSGAYGSSITIDKKGSILTLGVKNDFFAVVKYTPTGTQQWVSIQGLGTNDKSSEIVTDDSCNIYLTGTTSGQNCSVKLDSSGSLKWSKLFSANGSLSLKVDKGGSTYVTGNNLTTIKYNPAGEVRWVQTYPGTINPKYFNKLVLDDSANVYVTGEISYNTTNTADFITVKYDSSGNLKWSAIYNSTSNRFDAGVDLAVDNMHNVYVTGISGTGSNYISNDYLTLKYTNAGALVWTARYAGPGGNYDESAAIAIDNQGGVYVTGVSMSSNEDMLTVKYSAVTGLQSNLSELSDNFSLSQNYPNPFNPSTKINYELPITNYVTIKIYDALGNEVETLVNEKQNAGSYSVDFNAASLPSGIYFYKLVTENFSETKKMILIK